MARKPSRTDAVEEWKQFCEMRHEISREAYDAQDEDTKRLLVKICNRLRSDANDIFEIEGKSVKVEQKYLDLNCMFLAIEILSDLAMVGVRAGSYQLPENVCADCGRTFA